MLLAAAISVALGLLVWLIVELAGAPVIREPDWSQLDTWDGHGHAVHTGEHLDAHRGEHHPEVVARRLRHR